jgi:hypothetical protein
VYMIQASPDLISWLPVQTNSPIDGIMTLTNSLDAGQKYFRSVLIH